MRNYAKEDMVSKYHGQKVNFDHVPHKIYPDDPFIGHILTPESLIGRLHTPEGQAYLKWTGENIKDYDWNSYQQGFKKRAVYHGYTASEASEIYKLAGGEAINPMKPLVSNDMNAQFKKMHGTNFDPNSRMDRQKRDLMMQPKPMTSNFNTVGAKEVGNIGNPTPVKPSFDVVGNGPAPQPRPYETAMSAVLQRNKDLLAGLVDNGLSQLDPTPGMRLTPTKLLPVRPTPDWKTPTDYVAREDRDWLKYNPADSGILPGAINL